MKLLIMGLPNAGKTTLATALARRLEAVHYNADDVRKMHNDWDFSAEGRLRQAVRMGKICDAVDGDDRYVIADFVCPTSETRSAFGDAFVIWVDRIDAGRFEDTNKLFEPPTIVDVVVPAGMLVDEEVSMVMKEIDKRNKGT